MAVFLNRDELNKADFATAKMHGSRGEYEQAPLAPCQPAVNFVFPMENQEQVAQEILLKAANMVLPYVVAVQALRRSDRSPTGIAAGGTGCLVDTGSTRFLLTAKHVADEISTPEVIGIICGHAAQPVDISSWRLIDSDVDVDIATIAIAEDFDPTILNKEFYKPARWPPPRAVRGELAIFVGFPGIHRITAPEGVHNNVTPVCDSVSSSSNRHFVLADEDGRKSFEYKTGLPPFGPTGGVSGASVFINRNQSFELCGVVYEGGETEQATFFAAHAEFVRADGTIDRNLPR